MVEPGETAREAQGGRAGLGRSFGGGGGFRARGRLGLEGAGLPGLEEGGDAAHGAGGAVPEELPLGGGERRQALRLRDRDVGVVSDEGRLGRGGQTARESPQGGAQGGQQPGQPFMQRGHGGYITNNWLRCKGVMENFPRDAGDRAI